MHGKEEFAKIKGRICSISIETANIFNILPKPVDSNGLIEVKLKRDLKYKGYIYFEPVRPNVIYQGLNYLRTHNKFYEDISISEGFSSKEMINFSGIDKHQDISESIHIKYFKIFPSMYRTGSNETTLVSQIPSIINDEVLKITLEQGKKPVSILNDEFCEEQAFPYLLPKGKFGYKAP